MTNFLLNVDYKIIFKAIASRLERVLPNLMSSQKTAYVENRFVGASGRLIADIIEITDVLNKEGFLVTIYIEKPLNSLDRRYFCRFCTEKNLVLVTISLVGLKP